VLSQLHRKGVLNCSLCTRSVVADGDLPRDAWSHATGTLQGQVLKITLHDVGGRDGAPTKLTANVSGLVHSSCEWIDMEGAINDCVNATPPPEPDVLGAQTPPAGLRSCAELPPGPVCRLPNGQSAKCSACKGEICGCPGASPTSCRVCLFCESCTAENAAPPPTKPRPPVLSCRNPHLYGSYGRYSH
jgi:hypothetical protein